MSGVCEQASLAPVIQLQWAQMIVPSGLILAYGLSGGVFIL